MRIFDDLRYAHIYAYMRILADGYRHMAVSVRHQKSGMRGNPTVNGQILKLKNRNCKKTGAKNEKWGLIQSSGIPQGS